MSELVACRTELSATKETRHDLGERGFQRIINGAAVTAPEKFDLSDGRNVLKKVVRSRSQNLRNAGSRVRVGARHFLRMRYAVHGDRTVRVFRWRDDFDIVNEADETRDGRADQGISLRVKNPAKELNDRLFAVVQPHKGRNVVAYL